MECAARRNYRHPLNTTSLNTVFFSLLNTFLRALGTFCITENGLSTRRAHKEIWTLNWIPFGDMPPHFAIRFRLRFSWCRERCLRSLCVLRISYICVDVTVGSSPTPHWHAWKMCSEVMPAALQQTKHCWYCVFLLLPTYSWKSELPFGRYHYNARKGRII